MVSISNFCDLAVLSVENPGVWDDAEAAELLHPDDARRVSSALANLGYTLIPEDPVRRPYDGVSRLAEYYAHQQLDPPSWWIRHFDYL